MNHKLTQPKVRHYIEWLKRNDHFGMQSCTYDEKTNELLDEFFSLMEQIAPISENGTRALWLRAERGPIEDYGDPEEVACGEFSSVEEFINEWKDWFPDEVEWYQLQALELKDEGYRAVMLAHKFVIVQDARREQEAFSTEIPEFAEWLVDGIKECMEMLKAGTYNDFVRDNLPPQHRTGTISRKDFWNVWPEARAEFFKDISADDVSEFVRKASAQGDNPKEIRGRLPSMSANDFFRFCAMGYAANQYDGCDKTPKEQYYLHADGRDEGLREVDPDDPDAFHDWLFDRTRGGGHPWEVCRGGNSTHISLRPVCEENGYFLYLDGDAWNRTVETVKFYLASSSILLLRERRSPCI